MGQSIDINLEEKGWISRVRKVGNIRSLFTLSVFSCLGCFLVDWL